jgi:peroxiredoxin (alkyl hydroperoxide reductase subunit C)
VHLAWQREEKMLKDVRYPMGADTNGRVAKMFGVYDEETGLALRGTFIISPDRKLMNADVNYYNMGRNINEILRKFKANLYLAENTFEGCPAKWTEKGDKTLTPSAALVGKVHEELTK